MLILYLITLLCPSWSIPLHTLDTLAIAPTYNVTANDHTDLFAKLKSNPKQFISEVQKLDPASVRHIISLLEDLREASVLRENHLLEDLSDKGIALGDANTNAINAQDALDLANQAVALDLANQAAAQSDVDETREVHRVKQSEKDSSQSTHDEELPGLNEEQQVLSDVIALLQGLHDRDAGAAWELVGNCGANDNCGPIWADKCGKFGDLTTSDIVLVTMGEVKDFFHPTEAMTLCHFIANKQYSWSATESGTYTSVVPVELGHLGGSQSSWPTDGRSHLSFWGESMAGTSNIGGCCHYTSNNYGGAADGAAWHKALSISLKKV